MKRFIIDILFKFLVVGLLFCQFYYLSQLPTSGNVWFEGGSLNSVRNPVDVQGTVGVGNTVDVWVDNTVSVRGTVGVGNTVNVKGNVGVYGEVGIDTPIGGLPVNVRNTVMTY
tara:strand:- start:653 stop:991 length:339 start_codon:yes stop_codon:yes gene_type:complete